MGHENCMICGWSKRDDYWTSISSLDFDQCLKYREYLEIRKHGLSVLGGVKKNSMWLLRRSTLELLRQDRATDTGSVLWGCPDLPGSGSPTSSVQAVWESETGETALAVEQSLLHEAVLLLRGTEVSCHDHQGRGKRAEAGLACGQGLGQRIHAGTASKEPDSSSAGNRDRRDIPGEGTYLSYSGQRPGKKEADLVRWRRSV